MSKIKEQINQELKSAMKSGDSLKKNLLRVVLSEIDRSIDKNVELTDDTVQKVVAKMVKSAEMIGTDEAKTEINILSEYLPKILSKDETKYIVDDLFVKLQIESKKDMGKLMGVISKEYGNSIDKKLVSQIVNQKLG